MQKHILYLGANAMAAFMDFGVGYLIAVLVTMGFETSLPWQYLLIGGFCALIPDIDLVPSVLMGRSASFDHRQTLFHRPLLVVPIVTIIGFILGGYLWASIVFLCVVWHYLHDTNFTDTTYGIAWLWPFSSQYWSLWGSYMSQTDLGHHQWLETFWMKPSILSVREVGIGLISFCIAGVASAVPSQYLYSALTLIVLGILYVWLMEKFVGHA